MGAFIISAQNTIFGWESLNKSYQFTDNAVQRFSSAFKMFDTANTGQVSSSTMRNILGQLGEKMQADEIEIIINALTFYRSPYY